LLLHPVHRHVHPLQPTHSLVVYLNGLLGKVERAALARFVDVIQAEEGQLTGGPRAIHLQINGRIVVHIRIVAHADHGELVVLPLLVRHIQTPLDALRFLSSFYIVELFKGFKKKNIKVR